MKLVDTYEIVKKAYDNGYAVPAINVDNTDTIMGVFEVCQELKSPVIIQLSPIQIYSRNTNYRTIIKTIKAIGENIDVTCSIHLDHGFEVDDLKIASTSGFTSVMYDGSKQNFKTNIKNTEKVRKFCTDVSLEGELGVILGEEGKSDGTEDEENIYTNVNDAITFVKDTNVDFLAVAIGNAHGVYRQEPKLNFKRLKELDDALKIPLVMHGASGLSESDIKIAVTLGISKINFFTDVDNAYTKGIIDCLKENPSAYTFKYLTHAKECMKNKVKEIVRMCGSEGKS